MKVTTNVLQSSHEDSRPPRRWVRQLRTAAALCRLVPLFWLLGFLKHILPVRLLARWAWRPGLTSHRSNRQPLVVGRVLRAGAIAGVPDRDCLQRSLLLYRELSRHGFAPTLVIGFPRSGAGCGGHAWVVCGGEVVGERSAALEPFEPVLQFGSHGALEPVTPPAIPAIVP